MNAKAARIKMYFHCRKCLAIRETDDGKKVPVDLGEKLAVGWTEEGIQVVCENCGQNIIDIDFMGQKVGHYLKDPKEREKYRKELLALNEKLRKKNAR